MYNIYGLDKEGKRTELANNVDTLAIAKAMAFGVYGTTYTDGMFDTVLITENQNIFAVCVLSDEQDTRMAEMDAMIMSLMKNKHVRFAQRMFMLDSLAEVWKKSAFIEDFPRRGYVSVAEEYM